MTIRKGGIIYRVAYGWVQNPAPQTNLCRLFWRFWLSLLLIWPLAIILFVVVFLFGGRLRPIDNVKNDPVADWIEWWPEINKFPIVPIIPILVLGVILSGCLSRSILVFELCVAVAAVVLGALVWIGMVLATFFTDTEAGQLSSSWFAAKKAMVCPIVSIVGDEPAAPHETSSEVTS